MPGQPKAEGSKAEAPKAPQLPKVEAPNPPSLPTPPQPSALPQQDGEVPTNSHVISSEATLHIA